jgi:hypothetical protein
VVVELVIGFSLGDAPRQGWGWFSQGRDIWAQSYMRNGFLRAAPSAAYFVTKAFSTT